VEKKETRRSTEREGESKRDHVTHGLLQPDVQSSELVRRIVIQAEHVLEAVEARRGLAEQVVAREAGVSGKRPDVDRWRDNKRHFQGSTRRGGARDGCRVQHASDRTFVCIALQRLEEQVRSAGVWKLLS